MLKMDRSKLLPCLHQSSTGTCDICHERFQEDFPDDPLPILKIPNICDLCSSSKRKEAKMYCHECQIRLCDVHEQSHKHSPRTQTHILRDLNEDTKFSKVSHCVIHEEISNFFCHDCRKLMCQTCISLHPKRHIIKPVKEALDERKKVVVEMLEKGKKRKEELSTKLDGLIETLKNIEQQKELCKTHITNCIDRQIELLLERKEELLKTTEEISTKQEEGVAKEKNAVFELKDKLEGMFQRTDTYLEIGDSLLNIDEMILQRLHNLCKTEIEKYTGSTVLYFSASELPEIESLGKIEDRYRKFAIWK